MPRMLYVARTLNGEQIEGTLHAPSEQSLRDALSQKGLDVLSVDKSTDKKRAVWSGVFKPVKMGTLAAMTGQLALMLSTGTSLVDSLEALAEQSSDQRLAEILSSIARDVSGGSALGSTLASHPRVFDGFYISAVQAGEASGTLAEVFERLEIHLQKRVDLRNSIVTALIYPIIVSVLAVCAVIFLVTFVLPKFVDIFERGDVLLPLPTRMLMGLSSFIISYWYLLLGAAFIFLTAAYFYLISVKGRRLFDRVILWLPVIGNVVRMVQTTVLLRTLGTLVNAGVPLVETLEVAKGACKNSLFRQFAQNLLTGVLQGEDLASNFGKSNLMTPAIKQMVLTGEQTGNLAKVLNSVSDHLDEDADKQMKRLSALVEPLIIIFMGVLIGFIAISILLPLFRLTSAAKGG